MVSELSRHFFSPSGFVKSIYDYCLFATWMVSNPTRTYQIIKCRLNEHCARQGKPYNDCTKQWFKRACSSTFLWKSFIIPRWDFYGTTHRFTSAALSLDEKWSTSHHHNHKSVLFYASIIHLGTHSVKKCQSIFWFDSDFTPFFPYTHIHVISCNIKRHTSIMTRTFSP